MKNHMFNNDQYSSNYMNFYNCSYNISTINPSRESEGGKGEEHEIARKRTFDDTNIMSSYKDKKKKGLADEQQQLRSDIQLHTNRVITERRSQKLSDKITVLQKLVSPYGKTDTASVLEEAFISITALQIQIKNMMSLMFMSNINHLDSQQEIEDEEYQMELLSRMGLCLVPLSMLGDVTFDSRLVFG